MEEYRVERKEQDYAIKCNSKDPWVLITLQITSLTLPREAQTRDGWDWAQRGASATRSDHISDRTYQQHLHLHHELHHELYHLHHYHHNHLNLHHDYHLHSYIWRREAERCSRRPPPRWRRRRCRGRPGGCWRPGGPGSGYPGWFHWSHFHQLSFPGKITDNEI